MRGQRLHAFDLHLTEHVLRNVRRCMSDSTFAEVVRPKLDQRLLDYMTDHVNKRPTLLLGDAEFDDLALAFESLEPVNNRRWKADECMLRWSIETVSEVRTILGDGIANRWAQFSGKVAEELADKRVRLDAGIELVAGWSHEVRRHLRAMGSTQFLPAPEGRFPTPTYVSPPSERELKDMETMRQAIAKSEKEANLSPRGRHAKPDRLIELVDIRRQNGFRALRRLEALGQYSGFSRARPQRYDEGRPNER